MTNAARRLLFARLSVVTLLGAAGLPSSALAHDFVRPARLSGRLIVRERAGLSAAALSDGLQRSGARRIGAVAPVGATVIEVPERELSAIEATLRRSGLFKSVERDYLVTIAEEPNDTYYAAQWGLARIAAPAAWELSSGAGVVVAVLDTGIEASHPDLQGPTLPGYDFVNDDDDPADDHGHGTRMCGIIAAQRGNAEGIAGTAPGATLLPVKVLDWEGLGSYSAVASGITYAVDQGARVLNLSLVGPVQSDLLQDAVDYATAHDVIVVAASGNYGSNGPAYPAATAGAVAVSAINGADARPGFSNYGAWISFAAPGVDIATTSLGGSYASSSGTSPAAAFGSGILALLLSANPTLVRAEAIERVENGAVDLGGHGWDPLYGWGRADAYAALVPGGHGAPQPDETPPEVTILSPTTGSLMSGMVPVDVAANDNVAVARVELFLDNRWHATATAPPYQFVVDGTELQPGRHKLRAYAYDSSDHVARTKSHRILFTPGTGLLVGRAVAKATKITISADFALPPGAVFDPGQDSLSVTLTSASGTVLEVTARAGALSGSTGGRMKGVIAPGIPTAGSVRMNANRVGDPPLYRLKIKASRLNGMSGAQSLMNLGLQVGGVQLSQSLTFRAKGSTLLYP